MNALSALRAFLILFTHGNFARPDETNSPRNLLRAYVRCCFPAIRQMVIIHKPTCTKGSPEGCSVWRVFMALHVVFLFQ